MNSQYSDNNEDPQRKKASLVISTLMDRRNQLQNMDPFMLLKEVTESLNSPAFNEQGQRAQPDSAQHAATYSAGFGMVKNREIFL